MKKHALLAASILTSLAASLPAWAEVTAVGSHHSFPENTSSMMGVIQSRHIEELPALSRNYSQIAGSGPSQSARQEAVGTPFYGLNFRGPMFRGQSPALAQQSQLISSLRGVGFGSGGSTMVAAQINQLQPALTTRSTIHFNAGEALLKSHIGKSTSQDCADGSINKLRHTYVINWQEPILHRNAISSPITTLNDTVGTGKFHRYGFDTNRFRITLDPKILSSIPSSAGDTIHGGTRSGLHLRVDTANLSNTQNTASFDYRSNSPSSQRFIDNNNYQPRPGLNFDRPSKLKNLTSLSYASEDKSSQSSSTGHTFKAKFNFDGDEMQKVQIPSLSPTLGIGSSNSIFNPNCFKSHVTYVHLNLSSVTSSRTLDMTSTPALQPSYLGAHSLIPSIQPTLSGTPSSMVTDPAMGFGTFSNRTASPAVKYQPRELVVLITPHIVF